MRIIKSEIRPKLGNHDWIRVIKISGIGFLISLPGFAEENLAEPSVPVVDNPGLQMPGLHMADTPIPPLEGLIKDQPNESPETSAEEATAWEEELTNTEDPGGLEYVEALGQEDGSRVALYYYGIFLGPSIKTPKAYQPSPDGTFNPDYPILMKNYLGLGYGLAENMAITPTVFWTWRPVLGHQLVLQDPFLRLSFANIVNSEHINYYSDVRTHFGVSRASRDNEMRVGLQNFQALSYVPDDSGRIVLSLFGSIRYNVFGKHGYGNDLELYLAPHLTYRFQPKLAFTLLYEMQAVHRFGASVPSLENDGTDLEPGIEWNVSPRLTLNPYINLYPGDKLNLQTSSIGMTVSWNIL